jgi:hypothetical protein
MPKRCNQHCLPCLKETRLNSINARIDGSAGVLTWDQQGKLGASLLRGFFVGVAKR